MAEKYFYCDPCEGSGEDFTYPGNPCCYCEGFGEYMEDEDTKTKRPIEDE